MMSPFFALLVYIGLVTLLFRYDPAASSAGVSRALWVPLVWVALMSSRLPSQWLGREATSVAEAYQEGSMLDRTIYLTLIALAIWILARRSLRWGDLFSRHPALALLLVYTLVSVTWSEFPFIAARRWIRDLGNYPMVLVILTEAYPLAAIALLLRRLCYVVIPVSVLFVKYFPHLGRGYSEWTGAAYYTGITIDKNMLGVICLVSGLFFLWDTVRRWPHRRDRDTRRIIAVNAVFLAMTFWLLVLANSATAQVCLAVGSIIIVAVHSRWFRNNFTSLRWFLPVAFCVFLILDFGFGITDVIIESVGRDQTLTDRTKLWRDVLSLAGNPVLGAGYESFWLGDRFARLSAKWPFMPNQAHNGYIEVYINLGFLGLFAVAAVLMDAYRRIWNRMPLAPSFAGLTLAIWTVLLLYNVTEAAFKSHLLWFVFLLGSIAVHERLEHDPPRKTMRSTTSADARRKRSIARSSSVPPAAQ